MSSDTLIGKFKVYMLAFSIITGATFTLISLNSGASPRATREPKEIFELRGQVESAIAKAQEAVLTAEERGKDVLYAEEALKNARKKLSENVEMSSDKYEFKRDLLDALHYAKRSESLSEALTENSCVSCHSALENTDVYEKYTEWTETVHADNFVTCDNCHGGNAKDERIAHEDLLILNTASITRVCAECHQKSNYFESAHWQELRNTLKQNSKNFPNGVYLERIKFGEQVLTGPECTTCHGGHNIKSTRNPESTVFFKEVTETCGSVCHTEEYKAFIKSTHYKRLKSGKLAPECVTCHGSHTACVNENPSEVCAYCHSEAPQVEGTWHEFEGTGITLLESLKPKTISLMVRIR